MQKINDGDKIKVPKPCVMVPRNPLSKKSEEENKLACTFTLDDVTIQNSQGDSITLTLDEGAVLAGMLVRMFAKQEETVKDEDKP